MKASKQPIVHELERTFAVLNRRVFGRKLKTPTIIIQPDKKVVFQFCKESYHLVIGGKFGSVTFEEMFDHLLHECVHIHRYMEGEEKVETHGRRFAQTALFAGLHVFKNKGVTKVRPVKHPDVEKPEQIAMFRLSETIDEINFDKQIFRDAKAQVRATVEKKSRKQCFLKFECGCLPPHNSIRSGRRPDGKHPLQAICLVCNQPFRCTERPDGSDPGEDQNEVEG